MDEKENENNPEFQGKKDINIAPVKDEDDGNWDVVVDVAVVVGLAVLAVALFTSAPIVATAIAVTAVTIAVLEISDDRDGNIFDHTDNMLIAAGAGLMTLGIFSGSWMMIGVGTGIALVGSNDVLYDLVTGTGSYTVWILIAIAVFLVWKYASKDQKQDLKGVMTQKNLLILGGIAALLYFSDDIFKHVKK